MRRLISIVLPAAVLLVAAPSTVGLLRSLPWGHGEAAFSTLTCSVKPSCDVGEVAVFRMSGLANAHAQTASGTSYGNVVCCGGATGLSTSCSGSYDTVLRLSAPDNAHAAESDLAYTTEVCLASDAGMDCQHAGSCDAGYACLATISGTSNAHVADCDGSNDYDTKVCCAATAACIDRLGDTACDDPVNDGDDDGCADAEEQAGAAPPRPGSTGAYDPAGWYDFFDVPVPAKPDAAGANGVRNAAIDMADVIAVLFYSGATNDGPPNGNGVDYDTIKGVDLDGDTDNDISPPLHDIEEGQKYDRSPSPLPNPPLDAGPPNGSVDMSDVLAVLAQSGLQCTGAP